MLLLASFAQGRSDLLASALDDRLHQPYRSPLCPLLPALHKPTGAPGILGATLSGADPSVLVFLHPAVRSSTVRTRIAQHLQREGLSAELILTRITVQGARHSPGWRSRRRSRDKEVRRQRFE